MVQSTQTQIPWAVDYPEENVCSTGRSHSVPGFKTICLFVLTHTHTHTQSTHMNIYPSHAFTDCEIWAERVKMAIWHFSHSAEGKDHIIKNVMITSWAFGPLCEEMTFLPFSGLIPVPAPYWNRNSKDWEFLYYCKLLELGCGSVSQHGQLQNDQTFLKTLLKQI